MDKLSYITRQLARAEKKRFEHYVVTRIWHLLNDLTIKFTTQQYVVRPEGRALTDLFFPQLGIHVEVNEAHHLNKEEQDKLREKDIINATKHKVETIMTFKEKNSSEVIETIEDIEVVNRRIDEVVEIIREAKLNTPNFKAWDIEAEQNPQTYIERGYIDVSDDVAFRNSFQAANCFGYNYQGFQRGGTVHPRERNKIIWFPKLYKNGGWNNSISDDEKTIVEISEDQSKIRNHIDSIKNSGRHIRIVFARVRSPLGDIMYRFKGEFELDLQATNYQNGLVWRKTNDRVATYRHNDN